MAYYDDVHRAADEAINGALEQIEEEEQPITDPIVLAQTTNAQLGKVAHLMEQMVRGTLHNTISVKLHNQRAAYPVSLHVSFCDTLHNLATSSKNKNWSPLTSECFLESPSMSQEDIKKLYGKDRSVYVVSVSVASAKNNFPVDIGMDIQKMPFIKPTKTTGYQKRSHLIVDAQCSLERPEHLMPFDEKKVEFCQKYPGYTSANLRTKGVMTGEGKDPLIDSNHPVLEFVLQGMADEPEKVHELIGMMQMHDGIRMPEKVLAPAFEVAEDRARNYLTISRIADLGHFSFERAGQSWNDPHNLHATGADSVSSLLKAQIALSGANGFTGDHALDTNEVIQSRGFQPNLETLLHTKYRFHAVVDYLLVPIGEVN